MIGEEDPDAKQERLERHEEHMQKREQRLAQAQERRANAPPPKTGSVGKGMGEFVSTIGEHKVLIFGGIGAVIAAVIIYNMVKNGNSSAAAGTANQMPNYAAGGYLPSNISTALDSINAQLAAQGAQIGTLTNQPPAPTAPSPNSFAFPLGGTITAGGIDTNGQRWWEKLGNGQQELFYLPQGSRVFQQNGEWMYQTPNSTASPLSGQMVTLFQLPNGTLQLSGISQSSGVLPKLNVNTNVQS